MSHSLTWEVEPGLFFKVEANSIQELARDVSNLGGDFGAMKDQIKGVLSGEIPSPSAELGAAIKASVTAPPTTSPANAESGSASASASAPADPWADEGPAENQDDDPWGAGASDPTNSASTPSQSSPPQDSGSNATVTTTRDNLGREWTLNLPDAPVCECGIKAGKLKGISQKTNKKYVMWKCAKACGENWQSKCNFSEFPK